MASTPTPDKTSTATPAAAGSGSIHVGVGGWVFEPWRNNFYPDGLAQKDELHYASRQLNAIEINSTYYSSQKADTFAKWRDATPDGFVFSLKASRFCTNRRVLAEAGGSIDKFIHSGIAEIGPKLGPIVWQFAPTKVFARDDFGAFLALLPAAVDGLPLRHVMDVRHSSFMSEDYLALARSHGAATVFTDSDDFPSFADPTGGFIYARLMKAQAGQPTGYAPAELDAWTENARSWATGRHPEGLPRVAPPAPPTDARDVFIYFINGAKERAPAAAAALLQRLGWAPGKG